MYYRLRHLLPEWICVHPVELPGRGARMQESFVEDFQTLVNQLCFEYAGILNGNYALFGHSMGALLAYGIAQRQHVTEKKLPLSIFASACSAPAWHDPKRFDHRRNRSELINDLHRQGGTPNEVFQCDEMLDLTLTILAADYGVCNSFHYEGRSPLSTSIKVFAGRDDEISTDRIKAWREETNKEFSLDWFNGGHFFIRQHERQVLTSVANELTRKRKAQVYESIFTP